MVRRDMPKIVDHDERREALCLAAAKLIHEEGLEAATVRAIARAASCSTGVLAHYFADKDDLVAHVLAFVNHRPIARIVARLESEQDTSSVVSWLDEVLPLDEERRMEWSVRLAIWGVKPSLQTFAPSGQTSWIDGSRSLVELSKSRGVLPPDLDSDEFARRITAAIMGASLCAMFEPKRFDPTWLRGFIAETLDEFVVGGVITSSRASA